MTALPGIGRADVEDHGTDVTDEGAPTMVVRPARLPIGPPAAISESAL